MKKRCHWAGPDPVYIAYHDKEWGVPVHDDRTLYEFLVLEGAQAGLSWLTILKKRDHYRAVFDNFDPPTVAGYTEKKITDLMADAGIIRNRLKIEAAVNNARVVLSIREQFGTLDKYLWNFVDGCPIINAWQTAAEVPAETSISRAMSRDLKQRGASFVGPVICYAFMQAVGMVNDHTVDCFRHRELSDPPRAKSRQG
ncbi:MAG: DNA-3-methyladenine glycosylase I [Desulfosudaceae bacterium]